MSQISVKTESVIQAMRNHVTKTTLDPVPDSDPENKSTDLFVE